MENGDLTLVSRPTIVVVLEGVLATVEATTTGVLRKHTAYDVTWLPLPLKRLATTLRRFDVDCDVVTFTSQAVCDDAADFFNDIGLHVSSVRYLPFERWVRTLPYVADVQQVLDSDPERLNRYGQLGRAVIMGEDF